MNGTQICSIILLPSSPAFVSMQLGTGTPCKMFMLLAVMRATLQQLCC